MPAAKLQPVLALALALSIFVGVGCSGPGAGRPVESEPQPLPESVSRLATPAERLAAILEMGRREPGRLPLAAWQEAESALRAYLPELDREGEEDLSWRVAYTDLPAADYLAVDLMEGEGEDALRHAWFHVLYLPEPPRGESFDGPELRGFPTAGVPGRYLRLRAGAMDLLAVPEAERLKDDEALRELMGRFDLEGLAELGG